jgi:VWFA-related protein
MRIYGVIALMAIGAAGQQPPAKAPATKQSAAAAQQQAALQASGQDVTFKTTSSLVIVDVTVKDPKTGQTIDNLTEKDFAVFEDGKPQTVAVFEHEKLAMEAEPPEPPPTLDSQLELPEDPKTMITTEGPGKVQYHDKRLLVLFYDFSNMAVPDELRAQDATLKFIDSQMTESDLMSILLFTTTVQVKCDFTANRAQLKSVIENLPIGDLTDLADAADTGDSNEEDTGAAFVADETEFNIFNTDRKLAAIEDAVHKLALLPEKKVLVYVTGGLSKTGVDNQAQLEASINAAVKSNVAIYPIDARGLMADPPGGAASKGASRGSGIFNGSQYNAQRAGINDSQETLATLAADTGGKVFLDSNDLSLGIVQAQQAFRSYYILGYYTTNTALDGKYRKITVKLKTDLVAKLDFRQGYYANKVWGKFNGADKEMALQQALSAADPATDLPLALEVDWFRISPTAYYVPVSVRIPGSVIALAAKGAGGETEFDFVGNVMDERKAVVSTFRDYIKVKLDAGDKERLASRNFHYDAGCTLEPGRYRIRMLVRENQSGKMGTFDYKFVVPDLAADSMQLKTSSVVWSSQKESMKAAVGAAEKTDKKTVASNPLIFGDEKMVPNITKVFRRSQNLFIAFDVYDAAPDPANGSQRKVAVSLSLFNQKGVKAFEASPVEAAGLASTRPNAVPVQIQMPLKGLAPGRYTAQLNVMDEVGRKFSFPRQPIVVQ